MMVPGNHGNSADMIADALGKLVANSVNSGGNMVNSALKAADKLGGNHGLSGTNSIVNGDISGVPVQSIQNIEENSGNLDGKTAQIKNVSINLGSGKNLITPKTNS